MKVLCELINFKRLILLFLADPFRYRLDSSMIINRLKRTQKNRELNRDFFIFFWGCKFTEWLCGTEGEAEHVGSWGERCGVSRAGGGAGSIAKCPWARRFSGQTDRPVQRECFFPAAERSAPREVIMKSLLFINNSIDSLQIYYGHFFFVCLFFLLLLERLQKISLANPVRQD